MNDVALRFRRLWLSIGWLLVGVVVYVTLTPRPPDLELGIHIWDKLSHFLAFFLLMSWFAQIYHAKKTLLLLIFLLILFGIGLEILQFLGGIRTMEIADMIANSFGVFVGWILAKTRFAYILQRVENW